MKSREDTGAAVANVLNLPVFKIPHGVERAVSGLILIVEYFLKELDTLSSMMEDLVFVILLPTLENSTVFMFLVKPISTGGTSRSLGAKFNLTL